MLKKAAEKHMDAELQNGFAASINEKQIKDYIQAEKADLTEKLAEIETARRSHSKIK